MQLTNTLLLLAQALVYFGVMAALFRARHQVGIGVFVCALGVMHFLETYLASVFYITLPFGIISPGSTVLFSGKLLMILLLYIKEDALVVRQPIYGLLLGNLMIVGLVVILQHHEVRPVVPGKDADLQFVNEMGWLMVWGTVLLFVDAIALILIYEGLGRVLRRSRLLRLFLASAATLSFDQVGFFLALHHVSGAPWPVMFGGWVAKMAAAAVFSLLVELYLRFGERERPTVGAATRIRDVFQTLTYRERYETLLEEARRDPLTGALDRGQFEAIGARMLDDAEATGRPVSLLAVDIDHFKRVNDTFGHVEGDVVLRHLAGILVRRLRQEDRLFRYGGEEFVILTDGLAHAAAIGLAERLRRLVAEESRRLKCGGVTVSIGVATTPDDGRRLLDLFVEADKRLYEGKEQGRDRVVGRSSQPGREQRLWQRGNKEETRS